MARGFTCLTPFSSLCSKGEQVRVHGDPREVRRSRREPPHSTPSCERAQFQNPNRERERNRLQVMITEDQLGKKLRAPSLCVLPSNELKLTSSTPPPPTRPLFGLFPATGHFDHPRGVRGGLRARAVCVPVEQGGVREAPGADGLFDLQEAHGQAEHGARARGHPGTPAGGETAYWSCSARGKA